MIQEFIKKAHSSVNSGHIEISHWQKVVKIIFRQIIEVIGFTHSHDIVHNDILLENILIINSEVVNGKSSNDNKISVRFMTD